MSGLMSGLWTAVLALALPQGTLDQGVLVIRNDTVEVAREAFRLTSAPSRGDTSWTLTTSVRYDRTRPIVRLSPVLVVDFDSLPRTLQYDVADGRGARTILGQLGRNRLTLREVAPGAERAREFHVTGRTVVLDDSVFALYAIAAWYAGPQPVTITAIYPRPARREELTLVDHGIQATTVNRDPAQLRHLTLTGASTGVVHIWLAADGRLMKVEIPERRVRAERRPGD